MCFAALQPYVQSAGIGIIMHAGDDKEGKYMHSRFLRYGVIIVGTGFAAGTMATLAQVLLWLVLGADFPAVLFRDARLTAALVLGRGVLPPPATFDLAVWVVAAVIHFAISIACAALLGPLAAQLSRVRALLAGAVFGIALYVVNLYGFTEIFPWFAAARGGIAVAAHVVFGLSTVAAWRVLSLRYGQSRSGAH